MSIIDHGRLSVPSETGMCRALGNGRLSACQAFEQILRKVLYSTFRFAAAFRAPSLLRPEKPEQERAERRFPAPPPLGPVAGQAGSSGDTPTVTRRCRTMGV